MINPDLDLTNKTAVVTGASRGIGESAVKRLVAAGAQVVLLARSESAMQRIVDELGSDATAIACDVSDWASVNSAFLRIAERCGQVDILVNNAGVIEPIARLEEADPEAWSKVIDINLKGVFYCIHAALPLMKEQGGVIINISSGAATNALEGWSHYCASKAGVLSLTKSVHKEYAEQGIRCVGLSPGTVATNMQVEIKESALNPVSQLDWSAHISTDDVAEAITWLCTDAAKEYDGDDFSLKTDDGRHAVGLARR